MAEQPEEGKARADDGMAGELHFQTARLRNPKEARCERHASEGHCEDGRGTGRGHGSRAPTA